MTTTAIPIATPEDVGTAGNELLIAKTSSIDMSWLRPVWLRPYLLVMVLSVHVAIIGSFLLTMDDKVTPMQEIEVSVIPQGETVTEVSTVAAPQTAPIASPDPPENSAPEIAEQNDLDVTKPVAAEMTPDATPLLSAPLPKVEQPDASSLTIAKPDSPKTDKPQVRPAEKIVQIIRKKQREAERHRAMRAARLAEARAHAKQKAADFIQGAAAIRAGVRDGTDESVRMSQAAYAGLVSAELNRHKIYPSEGAQGRVGVVLSIGSSGAIVSHAITRSSGNSAIDAAVHQMVASSHPPPPPGGSFHGSVSINFNLNRY